MHQLDMEPNCPTQEQVLLELENQAPGAPFLALGQTIFWDEPMKAMVALASKRVGLDRRFVAGVHDTDYFAKLPGSRDKGGYKSLPHNDTTTKNLWAAAAEFSVLFGSETVITREKIQNAGGKTARVAAERPGYLDEVTEAWGWRGIASFNKGQTTTSEKPLAPLFPELYDTFDCAIQESLNHIAGPHRQDSERMADRLRKVICDASDERETLTLSRYFQNLLPHFYSLTAGETVDVDSTSTTELLRFNRETAGKARFDLVSLFVNPNTRSVAEAAYNKVVQGSEIYTLDRFGTCALPFDVLIPGVGRGTLRLGNRGGVIMTPDPVGFSFRKPVESAVDLAAVLEDKFGPNVVLIGKAVTLIGMLSREFVFVFHHGASSYVWRSRELHQELAKAGHKFHFNPILRVKLSAWSAMSSCCAWLTLPEPMRRPFGVDELSAPSFALRWKEATEHQKALLMTLSELRRPLDLIRFLQLEVGGHWRCLGQEYEQLHQQFLALETSLQDLRSRKSACLDEIKKLNQSVDAAQKAVGVQWREEIFEKDASTDALARREELKAALSDARSQVKAKWVEWRALDREQDEIVGSDAMKKAKQRRSSVSLEAELKRMKLIREAVTTTDGLTRSGQRPAAWWYPLVCPDGAWYRETSRTAQYSLEALV